MADSDAARNFQAEINKIRGLLNMMDLTAPSDLTEQKQRSDADEAVRKALIEIVRLTGGGKLTAGQVVERIKDLKEELRAAKQALRSSPTPAEVAADSVVVLRSDLGSWAQRLDALSASDDLDDPVHMLAAEIAVKACSL